VVNATSAQSAPQWGALTDLHGVGERVAERFAKLGIRTVADLLFHLPHRYQDRTRLRPIGTLRPGDECLVEVQVQASEVIRGRRPMLVVHVADGSGSITLRFFHFNAGFVNSLSRGRRVRCFGEARAGYKGLELIHPEFRVLTGEASPPLEASLTPVYPTTEGISQNLLRRALDQALARLGQEDGGTLEDYLPAAMRERYRLPPLAESIRILHQPPPDIALTQLRDGTHPCRLRLAFEELLAHNLSLRRLRHRVQSHPAPRLGESGRLLDRYLRRLPFEPTGAQVRVIEEIRADLARGWPMMRLVQGDVGSGKTVVAAAAALLAVESGHQVAVMAPTELLAEQHLESFGTWLTPLGITVGWIAGSLKGRARVDALARLADGDIQVAIGTHALFQEDVLFNSLALVVVDEQHRFGVHQRLTLREKSRDSGHFAHQLIMTATPIPRTLAMTAYADLDRSTIDELPPGRTPVNTVVLADGRRDQVIQRVRAACRVGRQAYWVCTLIEESEVLQCQAAEDAADELTLELPDLKVGLVHGRMKSVDKESAMAAFKAGRLDLLVATTVVEVGVDVPNASLMIIENAERLGLAQLHQLRGRVGRGSAESHCVLMYHGPLSDTARARLEALRDSNDGFKIAARDLEIRGPGELLGTRQTGLLQFRIADLMRDRGLLGDIQQAADELLDQAPDRAAALIARWVGERQDYGGV
jgi:ATP-dependent DNA helicase RecG